MPLTPEAARAAKLSRIPGVTIAEAAARFDVSPAAISRARKLAASTPTLAELALAALTRNGTVTAGVVDAAAIAAWLDYVNHDGCTATEALALLATCPQLSITGDRFTLLAPWP